MICVLFGEMLGFHQPLSSWWFLSDASGSAAWRQANRCPHRPLSPSTTNLTAGAGSKESDETQKSWGSGCSECKMRTTKLEWLNIIIINNIRKKREATMCNYQISGDTVSLAAMLRFPQRCNAKLWQFPPRVT